MRFKIDENLPIEVARLLRDTGHEATTVHDQGLTGAPDTRIVDVCRAEQRALVTMDLDFADIRTYPPDEHFGLVVLRLRQEDKQHVIAVMQRLLAAMPAEPLERRLWIVEETRVRVRE